MDQENNNQDRGSTELPRRLWQAGVTNICDLVFMEYLFGTWDISLLYYADLFKSQDDLKYALLYAISNKMYLICTT